MKKLMLKLVAAVMLLSVFVPSLFTAVHAEEEAEQTVSILVPGYDTGYLREELDAGIKAFEEAEGIKVEVIPVGWDELNSRIVQLEMEVKRQTLC